MSIEQRASSARRCCESPAARRRSLRNRPVGSVSFAFTMAMARPLHAPERPEQARTAVSQIDLIRDALLARSRREVRFAGSLDGPDLAGRPLHEVEVVLLREAATSGWVECPDALLSVLVDIG